MPAYFDQGFSVREPMWHGLGEVLSEYPGREKAMELAGHDFRVIERSLYVAPGSADSIGPGLQAAGRVKDWKALVHGDNGRVLNVVKDSYAVVQNDVLWDIVDAIVDQPNVRYETAGTLKDGAVLWVLAWLDEPFTVTGDTSPIYPYVLVSTTHDGSGACKAGATSIRVVCWNTYSMSTAQSAAAERDYTFRHTKNVMDRIEDAKLALHGIRMAHNEFLAVSEELVKLAVDEAQTEDFIAQLLPFPSLSPTEMTDRVVSNVEEARAAVRHILEGETISAGIRETGFGLFQAGIEYLDHGRRARSAETRFGRSLLRQERAKDKLVALVRKVAVS